jgi:hypothetical protein
MEQWEIRLDPRTGELDLEGLRRREFTEFLAGTDRGVAVIALPLLTPRMDR